MEKAENRLVQIFEELRSRSLIRTRTEMAELMEVDRTTLSSAMNGLARAYTPSIIVKAEQLRTRLLSGDNHTAPATDNKGVFIPPETLEFFNNLSKTIAHQAAIIDRLTSTGEQKKKAE